MAVISNPSKNASFVLETPNQWFIYHYIIFLDIQSFFKFLVSVTNRYINGLHLFLDNFEWFYLRISCDAKYFPSLVQGIVIED